jgi:hypothetical protein
MDMSELDIGLGNKLFRIVSNTQNLLFSQGELAQLSHSSFHDTIQNIAERDEEEITVSYPVGYKPSKESILSSYTYTKEELSNRYDYLMHTQLSITGIFQLSMIMEVMFTSLIREIVLEIPAKISSKKQVPIGEVLKSNSIEELQASITDKVLNELSYKSPRDFATEAEAYLSINLLECAAYHQYIEMKATRDVLIHNFGLANETYINKAGSHARVKSGENLPITQIYFLEAYEACLQLNEWLELKLNEKWYSSEYVERKQNQEAYNKPSNSDAEKSAGS